MHYTDIHTPCPERPEIRDALSTRLYAAIHPLYTQRAHTDIHIPRPERPECPEIRDALPTYLYTPTCPLYTQSAHTDIHTQRPGIRYALFTRS